MGHAPIVRHHLRIEAELSYRMIVPVLPGGEGPEARGECGRGDVLMVLVRGGWRGEEDG